MQLFRNAMPIRCKYVSLYCHMTGRCDRMSGKHAYKSQVTPWQWRQLRAKFWTDIVKLRQHNDTFTANTHKHIPTDNIKNECQQIWLRQPNTILHSNPLFLHLFIRWIRFLHRFLALLPAFCYIRFFFSIGETEIKFIRICEFGSQPLNGLNCGFKAFQLTSPSPPSSSSLNVEYDFVSVWSTS